MTPEESFTFSVETLRLGHPLNFVCGVGIVFPSTFVFKNHPRRYKSVLGVVMSTIKVVGELSFGDD